MEEDEVVVPLDEAEERLTSSLLSLPYSLITGASFAGLAAGMASVPGSPLFGTLAAVSFATFLYKLKQYRERRAVRDALLEAINAQVGGNAEEFVRQNPMAQVALDQARNTLTIRNPDGSTMIATPEMEELPSEPAAAGAVPRVNRALIRNIQDLPMSRGGYARNGAYSGESKSDY